MISYLSAQVGLASPKITGCAFTSSVKGDSVNNSQSVFPQQTEKLSFIEMDLEHLKTIGRPGIITGLLPVEHGRPMKEDILPSHARRLGDGLLLFENTRKASP